MSSVIRALESLENAELGWRSFYYRALSQSAQRALSYVAGEEHNSRMVLTTHEEGTGGRCWS